MKRLLLVVVGLVVPWAVWADRWDSPERKKAIAAHEKVKAQNVERKRASAKSRRGKRKDDREVKSISLGVISGSRWQRNPAPQLYYEPPRGYNSYAQPYPQQYHEEPAYTAPVPAYPNYGGMAYDDYGAQRGSQPQIPDRQPTFVHGGMDNRGNFYYPSRGGGGATWRSDGTFMINTGGGFINVNDGKFIPGQ